MQTAQTMRRPSLSATTIVMLAAVLIAFVLGGFGGYAVKAVTHDRVDLNLSSAEVRRLQPYVVYREKPESVGEELEDVVLYHVANGSRFFVVGATAFYADVFGDASPVSFPAPAAVPGSSSPAARASAACLFHRPWRTGRRSVSGRSTAPAAARG